MLKLTESANPNVKRLYGWQQLFELLVLLCATMVICGIRVLDRGQLWGWIAVWSIGLLICLFLALRFSQHAISQYSNARFAIGPQQLETLNAVEAPKDLVSYLGKVSGQCFRGEHAYFVAVTQALGSSRCEDLKPILFKYTHVAQSPTKLGLRGLLFGPEENIEAPLTEPPSQPSE